MKKLFKLLTLVCASSLLCSCSGGGPEGHYAFRMGRATGVSFSVDMFLKDDAYETTTKELKDKNPKQFDFDFTVKSDDADMPYILEWINSLRDEETGKFPGFYYLPKESTQHQICIGFKGLQDLFDKYEDIFEEIFEAPLPYNFLEKLIYCTLNGNNLEMAIPVSLTDLLLQLAWYGIYISPVNPTVFYDIREYLPDDGKHVPGYKITDADILDMNEKFKGCFCNTVVEDENGNEVAGLYNTYVYDKYGSEVGRTTHIAYLPGVDENMSGQNVYVKNGGFDSGVKYYLEHTNKGVVHLYENKGDPEVTKNVDIAEDVTYRKIHVVHLNLQKEN